MLPRSSGKKNKYLILPAGKPQPVNVDHGKEALARLDNAIKMFQDGCKRGYSEVP